MEWMRRGLMVLFALTAGFLLMADSRLMVDAAYMTLVPLALALLLLAGRKDYDWKEMWQKENRLHLFLSLCFTLLFCLMLSVTQIAGSDLYSYTRLQELYSTGTAFLFRCFTCSLYPAAAGYALLLLFFEMLQYAAEEKETGGPALRKVKYLGIYVYLLPVFILILCYSLSSFPNYLLGDSFMCWDQAVAGEWNDWDPIGYIFFLRLCSKLWNSFWTVRIIQSILYLYICNAALGLMFRCTGSKRACKCYVAVSSLILTPYIYLQLTYKDVMFTMALFAFCLCLLDCVTKKKITAGNLAAFSIFGLIVTLFRHGGIVPVLVGAAGLFLVLFVGKRKQDIGKAAGSLAVLLVAKVLIVDLLAFQVLNTTENPGYVTYTLPMVMAGAMASDPEVELTEDEITVMEIITPLEHWRESYAATGNGYWADPISRDWSTIGNAVHKIDDYQLGGPLLQLNLSLFKRYPVKYLTVFFNCNSLVWEIGRPSDGYEWAPVEGTCFEFENGYPSEEEMPRTAMTDLTLQLSNASNRLPIARSFVWRGGIWTFALLLSGTLLLLKRRWRDAIAILPILTVLAMLMLAIPAQDPRYVLGGVECGSFFLVYAIFSGRAVKNRNQVVK